MVKKLRDILVDILLVVCLILFGLAINEVRQLLRDARMNLAQTSYQLGTTLISIDATAQDLHTVAQQLGGAAAAQQAYWSKTSAELYKTTAAARLVLVRTDHSINDVLVPQLAETLKSSSVLQMDAAGDLDRVVTQLTPAIDNLTVASVNAAQVMGDPHIRESLANVDATSAQLVDVARDLDKTAANVANTTSMIEQRVKQVTTPARLSVRIAEGLLDYTVKAAQIAAGFIR